MSTRSKRKKRGKKPYRPRSPWEASPFQGDKGEGYEVRYLARSGVWQVRCSQSDHLFGSIARGHFKPHHNRDPEQRGRKIFRSTLTMPRQLSRLWASIDHPSFDVALRHVIGAYEAEMQKQMTVVMDWPSPPIDIGVV